MKSTLIICIGNEIRSDDSAALYLKNEFEKFHIENVEILAVHQLTPELAEFISHYNKVIFVDASIEPIQKPILRKLCIKEPKNFENTTTHFISPETLILITKTLYEKIPEAYLLSIPAVNFEFGTELNPSTKQKVHQALETLKNFLT